MRDWSRDGIPAAKLAHASGTVRQDMLFNYIVELILSAMLAYLVRLLLEARAQKRSLKKVIEKRTEVIRRHVTAVTTLS
ncbi:hypothetical protein ACO0K9_20740 [Undibacterium sp. Ji50W]|uniref:hypothetical protein n=1 Tax=Undibacterium sp. Ji50W TaxID=3413041 RepID=UPI003BF0F599